MSLSFLNLYQVKFLLTLKSYLRFFGVGGLRRLQNCRLLTKQAIRYLSALQNTVEPFTANPLTQPLCHYDHHCSPRKNPVSHFLIF